MVRGGAVITVDRGTEFHSRTLEELDVSLKYELDFIRSSKLVENAF